MLPRWHSLYILAADVMERHRPTPSDYAPDQLRNQSDLDGLVEELGAIHPRGKKGILDMYHRATSVPFGFLYCNLMEKDPARMFMDKEFQPLGL